jgi:predicted PurR-regulated permease PerM
VGGAVMDNQAVFNFVVAIAGFLAVFVFNSITRKIQKLEDEINKLPKEYVQKDDYRSDITEVKQILKQIFDKLDSKADKQ